MTIVKINSFDFIIEISFVVVMAACFSVKTIPSLDLLQIASNCSKKINSVIAVSRSWTIEGCAFDLFGLLIVFEISLCCHSVIE